VISEDLSVLLQVAIQSGLNIVVTGSVGAGKTTILGALLRSSGLDRSSVGLIQRTPTLDSDTALLAYCVDSASDGQFRSVLNHLASLRPSNLFIDDCTPSELSIVLEKMHGLTQVTAAVELASAAHLIAALLRGTSASAEGAGVESAIIERSVPIIVEIDTRESGQRSVRSVLTPEVADGRLMLKTVFERSVTEAGSPLLATGETPAFLERLPETERKEMRKRLSGK
jgi:hypothetical protein